MSELDQEVAWWAFCGLVIIARLLITRPGPTSPYGPRFPRPLGNLGVP
jgi:hypothetical protein